MDLVFFFLMIRRPPRSTLFPTRRSSDLARTAREVAGAGGPEARRLALSIRLALARAPLDPAAGPALDAAWGGVTSGAGGQLAVRSSARCEDTALASFAGPIETFTGIAHRSAQGT